MILPTIQLLPLRRMAAGILLISSLAACGGGDASGPMEVTPTDAVAGDAAAMPPASPGAAVSPGASGADLCFGIAAVEQRLASLQGVELRLPNRVALEIELGKLQAAFSELQQADLGDLEERLETPLTRLDYRLQELELAVEDFRTNSRPGRAAPHVEEDGETFAAELAAFSVLARC